MWAGDCVMFGHYAYISVCVCGAWRSGGRFDYSLQSQETINSSKAGTLFYSLLTPAPSSGCCMQVSVWHVCIHLSMSLGEVFTPGPQALSSELYLQYWHQSFEGATKGTDLTFSDTFSWEGSRSKSCCPIRNKKMPNPEN